MNKPAFAFIRLSSKPWSQLLTGADQKEMAANQREINNRGYRSGNGTALVHRLEPNEKGYFFARKSALTLAWPPSSWRYSPFIKGAPFFYSSSSSRYTAGKMLAPGTGTGGLDTVFVSRAIIPLF